MKKFRVEGTTVVTVYKEVWAANEDDAFNKAFNELSSLTAYCGNGGYDKLVGVENHDESVEIGDTINYESVEELENDPSYMECPECGEECEQRADAEGVNYWWCECCCNAYDEDGDEFYPAEDDDEE